MLERAVGVEAGDQAPGRARRSATATSDSTSIRPEPIRGATEAGGRSSATASPVTRSSEESIANSGDDIAVSIGSGAWTWTPMCSLTTRSGSGSRR